MKKILLESINRNPTPRRPLWIMRQAGRYLPEYRALRKTHSFKDLSRSSDFATEVTLLPIKRFDLDAAIIFADIMSPVPSLGIDFDFNPGPIITNPISDNKDVDNLIDTGSEEIAPEVMKAIAQTRSELSNEIALLGFCGAPWTLSAYLVEGKGNKDFPKLRSFLASEPEVMDRLLEKLTLHMISYLKSQVEAGVDAVQIFDSWAGLLSLDSWQKHIKPHLEFLLSEIGKTNVPRIIFLQNAPHLVNAYAELPSEVLAVDWRVNLSEIKNLYGKNRAIQGNLDPAILVAGPEATRQETKKLLKNVDPVGHIMNLGHGIMPNTPLESVDALIDEIHNEENRE